MPTYYFEAMDATGQNVVNANTPGYSRQRVLLSSVGAPATSTFHTGSSTPIGGVKIDAVSRIRDSFIEATRAAAGSRQAHEWQAPRCIDLSCDSSRKSAALRVASAHRPASPS